MKSHAKTLSLLALASLLFVAGAFVFNGPTRAPELDEQPSGTTGPGTLRTHRETPARKVLATEGYSAPVGRIFTFALNSSFKAKIHHSTSEKPSIVSQTARGHLELAVVGRRAGEILVTATFPDFTGTMTADGARRGMDQVEKEMKQSFGLRMSTAGKLLGYRFPTTAAVTRRQVRMLVSALHFFLKGDSEKRWEVDEIDDSGPGRTLYETLSSTDSERNIRRTRLSYTRNSDEDSTRQPSGVSTGRYDHRAGWMADVDHQVSVAMTIPGSGFRMTYGSTVQFQLAGFIDRPDTVAAPDWNAPEGPVSGTADTDEDDAQSELAHLDPVVILDNLSRLAQTKDGIHKGNASELYGLIVELVEARPETLKHFRDYVFAPGSDVLAIKIVLAGIGKANTHAAQAFFADTLVSNKLRDEVRHATAIATMSLIEPRPEVLAGLRHNWQDPKTHPELAATSLLMLGASARRAQEGAGVVKRLIGLEADAKQRGQLRDWLGALGNAGTQTVIEAVEPYLSSTDRGLRLAAVESLRKIQDPQVGALLAKTVKQEKDPGVRARAARWLAVQPDPQSLKIAESLMNDGSAEVRHAVLAGLRRQRADNSEAMRILTRVARENSDPSVREAARKFLSQSNS